MGSNPMHPFKSVIFNLGLSTPLKGLTMIRKLVYVTMIIGVFLAVNANAYATTVSPELQTKIDNDVVQGIVRNFGAVPITGGDPTTVSSWTGKLKSDGSIANNTFSSQLAREATTITQKVGFLGKVRFLGSVGLGLTSFDAGWKIGSGVNAKFLHFNTPSRGDSTAPVYSSVTANYSPPKDAGACTNYDGIPAFYCTNPNGFWQVNNNVYYDKFVGYNQPWPTLGKAPWHNYYECGAGCLQPEAFVPSSCCTWIRSVATEEQFLASILDNTYELPKAYTGQPLTYDTGINGVLDLGVAGTTSLVNSTLHSGTGGSCPDNLSLLCAWLNNQANPTVYPNPIKVAIPKINEGDTYQDYADKLTSLGLVPHKKTAAVWNPGRDDGEPDYAVPDVLTQVAINSDVDVMINPDYQDSANKCSTAIPTLIDPDPDRGWFYNNAQYDVAQTATPFYANPAFFPVKNTYFPVQNIDEPPGHYLEAYTGHMRWGRTKPKYLSGNLTGFTGWGYRQILAGSGWNQQSETKTGEALRIPVSILPREAGSLANPYLYYTYIGPVYTVGSGKKAIRCQWQVDISFDQDAWEAEQDAYHTREIIRSRGRLAITP